VFVVTECGNTELSLYVCVAFQYNGELTERVQQVTDRHMALSNRLLTSFRYVDALEGRLAAQTNVG
jgi:hypothetical protein